MLALHENECYNFDIFKDNLEDFSNFSQFLLWHVPQLKKSSTLVLKLSKCQQCKNGQLFYHHFLFKIKLYVCFLKAFMDIEKSELGKLTLFSNIIPFINEELVFALIQVHTLFLEFIQAPIDYFIEGRSLSRQKRAVP